VDTAWVRGSHRDMATCAARSRIRVWDECYRRPRPLE
jgi:hypothetical protein